MARVIGAATLVRDLGEWRGGSARRAAYVALAEGIRLLVHDGRLPLGVALPSERDLSAAAGVSRTTVTSAYGLLRERGYLVSRQGSRSTVAMPAGGERSDGENRHGGKPTGVSLVAMLDDGPAQAVDLTFAAMAAPDGIAEAYEVALAELPAYLPTHGMDPVGVLVLRETLARRYTARGLPTSPDQILVTLGAQHGLRLLLNVLVSPGERVLIEHPTYPNAVVAIRGVGAHPVPVALRLQDPVNAWDLDGIRSAARQTAARMAYLMPDFNNPTGLLLDAQGREQLAAMARETRMTVIVDESLADLALDCEPAPPAARFATGAEIISIGSVSKSFWGGIRVGWIRANRGLITQLLSARAALDLGTPLVDQLAAGHLLEHGESILDHTRDELRTRRAVLREAMADELPEWGSVNGAGGMSLWARLPAPVSTALAATAPNFGVLVAAGPRFGAHGAFEQNIRLPYAQPPEQLRIAVKALAAAYAALTPRMRDPLPPFIT